MKTEQVAISTLTADPKNARVHGVRNLAAIRTSLERFGQQKPIVVDGKGQVVAGNGTLAAAAELGWEKIAVVRTKLVGDEARAFALADNRASELAEWDFPTLSETLAELGKDFDLSQLGWDKHDLEPLLAAEWNPSATGAMPGKESAPRVTFNDEQWAVVQQAIARCRGDAEMTDAEALASICRSYVETSA